MAPTDPLLEHDRQSDAVGWRAHPGRSTHARTSYRETPYQESLLHPSETRRPAHAYGTAEQHIAASDIAVRLGNCTEPQGAYPHGARRYYLDTQSMTRAAIAGCAQRL